MPTTFTETLIIVVKAALKPQADAMAVVADPTTGAETFIAKLRAASDPAQTVTHYWARWVMQPEQRTRLEAEFGKLGNLRIYTKGENVQSNRDYWLFEAAEGTGWTGREVLTALSLAPVSSSG